MVNGTCSFLANWRGVVAIARLALLPANYTDRIAGPRSTVGQSDTTWEICWWAEKYRPELSTSLRQAFNQLFRPLVHVQCNGTHAELGAGDALVLAGR